MHGVTKTCRLSLFLSAKKAENEHQCRTPVGRTTQETRSSSYRSTI